MNNVHIYTAALQPATCWTDSHSALPMTFKWPANRLLWCGCCRKLRPAKNCVVQSFYDGINVWCATDKGCKGKVEIASKKLREFRNRSAGQRKRWAK